MNLKLVSTIGRVKRKVWWWRMPVGAAAASVVESVDWGEVRSASSRVSVTPQAPRVPRGARAYQRPTTLTPMWQRFYLTRYLCLSVYISLLHKCYLIGTVYILFISLHSKMSLTILSFTFVFLKWCFLVLISINYVYCVINTIEQLVNTLTMLCLTA